MDPFLVAVTLYVFPGREDAFEEYEARALARVVGHRGRVVVRMRCAPTARGEEAPYEFHLLSFPSQAAFETFVSSGVPFEDERERIMAKTVVLTGNEVSLPKDR